MPARLNPFATEIGPKITRHLQAAHHELVATTVPTGTMELVNIRVSQINGCGACLDMHVKEAARAGEDALRINLVGAWRETTVFSDAERAALELAEAGTRLADGAGVSDEIWEAAAKHYDEEELMVLVSQIAFINAATRMNVMLRVQGGGDKAGSLG
ncbi:carboxymuconolactone decarboxylase family protein [Luteipulveratus halotolerans]|uniref:Alkylhydroperoxidase n=1 Tax=Luteipulveratus halotolerans TaxID=1631356 RepID=A0A0L6CMJ8_9MICO|nr:carboxymuconolactone decarboxylase family protein [Luteipulveratus halotolerans]KNX38944.1 alkylhydroperoxidase [Luteipulveratus halotolerans]